ncbi:phosducin-like protein [Callorhinchus milii]|uniref:Phosducin-like n=1 Tax=Callorhinchus milii TaxID=7868 RepID=V9L2L1_CALMI|nr:phosducin-like protein [Callorhinchus milii]XP_007900999.1 phosducin-like protein [Callorhinchus milii]XP_007901000.1 phosducin-like protein [Callorhinchus milii]XP_007901001.1 phosducin-like protein [Callorhinchus milii]XP_042193118.1 phosducin-like protein [Callorhinchus milii]|eukprot:gi/632969274/ref/XP_007900998.1/ PREDICTED: phosducin-like protein [Callorhinchus milii]
MTTLDDKILGEKLQYYYSSSEDEDSDHEGSDQKTIQNPSMSVDGRERSAVNTGPKGVINDWRRFKQLETEQREEQRREMSRLIKKLSMSCRSHLDDEKDKQKQKDLQDRINGKMTMQEYNMIHEGDDEEFLAQYRKQRMDEMKQHLSSGKRFEQVYELTNAEDFLDTIDKEEKGTVVVVHIYEEDLAGCESMNGCLLCLAGEYPLVKFCKVRSSLIGASARFTGSALPALLVYKGGDLIGNFVRITDQLGEDFFAVDVEAFLREYGMLPEKDVVSPTAIRNASVAHSDDSDLDID